MKKNVAWIAVLGCLPFLGVQAGNVVAVNAGGGSVQIGSSVAVNQAGVIGPDVQVEGIAVINGEVFIDGVKILKGTSRYKSPSSGKSYQIVWGRNGHVEVEEK